MQDEMSFYGEIYSHGCPGCNRVEPQREGLSIVYENDYFRVHQDYALTIPGLMVIESKRHVFSIIDLNEKELTSLMFIICKVREALKSIGIEESNLVQEEKRCHFHIWWLPIYPWMKEITEGKTRNNQIIFEYSKKNLINSEEIKKVEEATNKIKIYLESI